MKKTLCIVLSLFLILVSFSACKKEDTPQAITNPDYLSKIMKSPNEHPQLTKEEFIYVTQNYLEKGEWELPTEKACFYTYGVNYSAYIVENEFLFSLYLKNLPDGSVEYDFCLSHYIDGVAAESENAPLLFEKFLN
ncbi:MAG: hypothetical protein E7533_06905 [Ruminococcaceae bacterium]|nr:hypothetical protein [Oscillospiraceae bacterium]